MIQFPLKRSVDRTKICEKFRKREMDMAMPFGVEVEENLLTDSILSAISASGISYFETFEMKLSAGMLRSVRFRH